MNTRNGINAVEFLADLYDVIALNTNRCTQKKFFYRYIDTDKACCLDEDEMAIHLDDYDIVLIEKNK